MGVPASIKALLSLRGKKQSDLIGPLGMSSKQSLSNKFTGERWFASDLVRVAELCGCKVAFILPDGQQIFLDESQSENETTPDA